MDGRSPCHLACRRSALEAEGVEDADGEARRAFGNVRKIARKLFWIHHGERIMSQRLLWTVDGPHTPDQAGYAARLVGWHTALALPLRSLVAADRWGTPCGDTLDGRRGEALRVLDEFERTGLRFEAVAGRLAAHGEKRLVRSWEALRGTVGTQLRLHGAR